jgi:hypothetical protein
MVQIRSRDPVTIYEMMDDGGRPIGEVRQPAGKPVVGWGQGTVYLRREEYRSLGRP